MVYMAVTGDEPISAANLKAILNAEGGFVTEDMIVDQAVNIPQLNDYVLFKIGILDMSGWSASDFKRFAEAHNSDDDHNELVGFITTDNINSWSDDELISVLGALNTSPQNNLIKKIPDAKVQAIPYAKLSGYIGVITNSNNQKTFTAKQKIESFSWANLVSFAGTLTSAGRSGWVGKTKSSTVSGYGNASWQVIGVDHDDKVGGGKALLTFQSVNIITMHNMNSSNTTRGGWASTAMRTWLEGALFKALPSDLQSVIVQVKKKYRKDTGTSVYDSNDKLWLYSEKELTGGTEYGNEGSIYAYWSSHNNNNSRIKKLNNSNGWWWLRSVYDSTTFRSVGSDGSLDGDFASDENGVAPCFSIG